VGRLAVVGKHQTLGAPAPDVSRPDLGSLGVLDHGTHVSLYRHGLGTPVPPHEIDHAAHLRALAELGCDRVLALSSVGSLHRALPVGSFVVPDDFIALDQRPVMVERAYAHVVPGFTPAWRSRLLATWPQVTGEPVVAGGVYWQANGPRFETPAEVRLIAASADLVGMTVPSECVAANQAGLAYAAVCVVDNLANGVGDRPLTIDEFERGAAANAVRLASILERLLPELAR
jgi:5'-methylthioadenosine phosphorylase